MSKIARYYESEANARAAFQALITRGYSKKSVALVTPATSDPMSGAQPSDNVSATANARTLLGDQSSFHASIVKRGYSLVIAEPPFGGSLPAIDILDEFGPMEIADERLQITKPPALIEGQAAPLSSGLGLRVLSDSAAPLSDMLNLKTLSNRSSFISRMFGELTESDFALSNKFGMSCLSSNAAPLSSMIGLPVKSGKVGQGWTRSFGFKMLSDHATPLSALVGVPALLDNYDSESYAPMRHRSPVRNEAAPLSNMIGWNPIAKGRTTWLARMFAPLTGPDFSISSMFGMPMLSGKTGQDWTQSFGFKMLSDNASPLSGLLGIPLLEDHNYTESYAPARNRAKICGRAAPLSNFFGLGLLAKRSTTFLTRSYSPANSSDFALSRMFGMPMLSGNAAPLSSMFNIPVKSGADDPAHASAGMPQLFSDPAPLSNVLGLPVLSRHRTLY